MQSTCHCVVLSEADEMLKLHFIVLVKSEACEMQSTCHCVG